jgi:lipopolysaccharide transport system ATP-binding protein
MGKMGDVAKEGRTVLLVSHNMSAIINLCDDALVLEKGRLVFAGNTQQAVEKHLSSVSKSEYGFVDLSSHVDREMGMSPIATAVGLRTRSREGYCATVTTGDDLIFDIYYDCNGQILDEFKLAVSTLTGQRVFTVGTHLCPGFETKIQGRRVVECHLPHVSLAAGEYTLMIMMGKRRPPRAVDYLENALRFRVELGDYFGTGCTLLPGQGPHAQKSDWVVRA